MGMKEIDTVRFLELARMARASRSCRHPELGEIVSRICKKALCYKTKDGKDFLGYSEDIKLDMYGNAVYAVYRAILDKAELKNGDDLFNYSYTVALNSIRRVLRTFNTQQKFVTFDEGGRIQNDVFGNETALSRKRMYKGFFAKYEKAVLEKALGRKMIKLQNVIKMSIDEFVKSLNKRKLKSLIAMAAKIREEAC